MIWTLRYKETEKGPWISTVLRGATSTEVWMLWSSPARTPRDYYAAMVLPL
ncbi:MAG TPA: hypothetical protein VLT45_02485 [Kofleriaceae bacterium]|nr:hypothetical protein [Kofleriaceae bacterium]